HPDARAAPPGRWETAHETAGSGSAGPSPPPVRPAHRRVLRPLGRAIHPLQQRARRLAPPARPAPPRDRTVPHPPPPPPPPPRPPACAPPLRPCPPPPVFFCPGRPGGHPWPLSPPPAPAAAAASRSSCRATRSANCSAPWTGCPPPNPTA